MINLQKYKYELELDDISNIFKSILDKLDQQSSDQRSRNIKISINPKNLPSLYAPKEFNDDQKLISAIKILLDINIFTIEESKKDSFRDLTEKEKAKLVFNYDWEKNIRLFYNRNINKDDWNEIVDKYQLDDNIKNIILRNKIFIKSKSNKNIIEKLINLLIENNINKSVRHVSSKYFWGLSKILDNKIEIIKFCKLKISPILLHVKSFSNNFKNILFIENLDTYNELINSNNIIFKNYLIIYSSGFKATAKRLRTKGGSNLFFEDNCLLDIYSREIFKNWLYLNEKKDFNVFLWGDLDNTGISIFITMKKIFPELEIWRPGYDKLIKAIDNNDFHNPEESNKEGQLEISLTSNEYIDTKLLPILRNKKFVDQEYVDIESMEL